MGTLSQSLYEVSITLILKPQTLQEIERHPTFFVSTDAASSRTRVHPQRLHATSLPVGFRPPLMSGKVFLSRAAGSASPCSQNKMTPLWGCRTGRRDPLPAPHGREVTAPKCADSGALSVLLKCLLPSQVDRELRMAPCGIFTGLAQRGWSGRTPWISLSPWNASGNT